MSDARHQARRGRSVSSDARSGGGLANEQRLRDLGDAVARHNGAKPAKTRRRHKRSKGRIASYTAVGLVVVILLGSAGSYLYANYLFSRIHKFKTPHVFPVISGKPFNILEIGSDSRAGLSGKYAGNAGNSVSGQRSDVIKIMHVDPSTDTVSIVSIPRDTLVTLIANQGLFGNYNRINVNYINGADLLVRTIEANFGIPINHVIQVSFGGLINSANALGGVYLNFPYPSHDSWSGLHIAHAGCQVVKDWQALAIVRSRHFYYNIQHKSYWPRNAVQLTYAQLAQYGWIYDGTSDYGRIQRQDAFLRGLVNAAKGKYNPLTINSFLSSLPAGISLDTSWSLNELLGLAYHFRNFSSSSLHAYTLPTVSAGLVPGIGDVLTVDQPAAQKLLVGIFGAQMHQPSKPPPKYVNGSLIPNPPPYVAVTTTTTSTVPVHHKHHKHHVTPTTVAPSYEFFNPRPCTPT